MSRLVQLTLCIAAPRRRTDGKRSIAVVCDLVTVISIPMHMRFNVNGQKLLNPGFNRWHIVRFLGKMIALDLSIVYVPCKRR